MLENETLGPSEADRPPFAASKRWVELPETHPAHAARLRMSIVPGFGHVAGGCRAGSTPESAVKAPKHDGNTTFPSKIEQKFGED